VDEESSARPDLPGKCPDRIEPYALLKIMTCEVNEGSSIILIGSSPLKLIQANCEFSGRIEVHPIFGHLALEETLLPALSPRTAPAGLGDSIPLGPSCESG
jgi:hypothetical protein